MKIIDRNGRLFGKISIIDVLVILVVAVLAVALYTKNNNREITSTTADVAITYQVLAQGIPDYVADAIREGDALFEKDRKSGGSLGEIQSIEIVPGTKLKEMQDGTMAELPVEGGVNVLLTVQGKGIVSDGRYLINRIYDLGVNAAREMYTPYAQFVGTVVEIQK